MTFPVIAIKKADQNIYYFDSIKPLSQTSQELFDKKIYEHVKFIDSHGFVFIVNNVRKLGFAGLWGFNPLLKGRQIKIALEYEAHPSMIDLNDLKSLVFDTVSFESNALINEIREKILSATTHKEVIELLK